MRCIILHLLLLNFIFAFRDSYFIGLGKAVIHNNKLKIHSTSLLVGKSLNLNADRTIKGKWFFSINDLKQSLDSKTYKGHSYAGFLQMARHNNLLLNQDLGFFARLGYSLDRIYQVPKRNDSVSLHYGLGIFLHQKYFELELGLSRLNKNYTGWGIDWDAWIGADEYPWQVFFDLNLKLEF